MRAEKIIFITIWRLSDSIGLSDGRLQRGATECANEQIGRPGPLSATLRRALGTLVALRSFGLAGVARELVDRIWNGTRMERRRW